MLQALFKRPRRASATAPLTASYRLDRIDVDHVRRYNAGFGFPGDAVPLTFLYLLAQRAQLATLIDQPIPFRIPGLIHLDNRLEMHGAIDPDQPLALTTTLVLPPPSSSGATVCVLETRAVAGARLVFACDSTYLIKRGSRTRRDEAAQPAQSAKPPGEALGRWTLAPDAGRRYAALSGDWNPIHLWPWSARMMGMREPIIHGMHTVAKACALRQQASGDLVTRLDCSFRSPVPVGAEAIAYGSDATEEFTVLCNGRTAIKGHMETARLADTSRRR